jgi:hypothetical protein
VLQISGELLAQEIPSACRTRGGARPAAERASRAANGLFRATSDALAAYLAADGVTSTCDVFYDFLPALFRAFVSSG